jgi:hypothetical protein
MKSPQHGAGRNGARVLVVAAVVAIVGFASTAYAGVDTVTDVAQATTTFNGTVWSVAYAGNTVYVGGDFTKALSGNKAIDRAGLAAVDATTGALLPWTPTSDGTVKAMAVNGSTVYLGGNFANIDGVAAGNIAAVDASTGALVASFSHSVGGEVRTLATGNGLLYAGGTFTTADGLARGYLAAYDLTTAALSTTWAPTAEAHVNSLVFANNQVYVGGLFKTLNGASQPRLRALNATTGAVVTTWKPAVPYEVDAIAVDTSGVYAAVAGPGGRAMAFSNAGAALWTLTTDGNAQAIAVMGQTVYIGGHFDNVCATPQTGSQGVCLGGSTPRGKLCATDLSGNLQSWNPNGDGIDGTLDLLVNPALHVVDAVGSWPHLGGVNHHGFAQFG